jgi:uncharacterized protein (TIGR02646 family)
MTRLEKLPAAHRTFGHFIRDLAADALAYELELAAGRDASVLAAAYRKVKPAVARETADKCAYCECKVTDVYVGDVEHILPKGGHPERTLNYANLTFVCWYCNNNKRDIEFTDRLGLLNPYVDEPTEYVRFFGTALVPVPKDPHRVRAKRTIDSISLNRAGLLESRERMVRSCELLELAYHAARHPAVRELTEQEIREAQDPGREHSMLARSYFQQAGIAV